MKRFSTRFSAISLAVLGLSLIATDAFAINGLIFYGVGPRNRAMGGANGALPVDTSTILTNPAGLGKLGNRVDIGAHWLKADRFRDLSGTDPSIGVANTAAGQEESGQTVYITPFSGLSYKPENSKWAFGATIAGVAGEGAQYDSPRINPALLTPGQTYDTESFLFVLKAVPAVSYDYTDKLTLGLGLQISAAFFSGDFAVPTPNGFAPTSFPQTEGRGKLEISYGYAVQLGAMYDINEKWTVGVAYQNKTRFEEFGPYKDVIPDFELPPEFRVGIAWHVTPKLDLTLDYKWIGWEEIRLFEKEPTEGGFGYVDQHTVGAGIQYKYRPNIILRGGVNYGRSPVRKDVVFANSLAPTVYQTSVAAGGEYKFGKKHTQSIATSLVYKLGHSERDNGKGDLFSQVGKGTRIGYRSGFDADIVWSIEF